MSAKATGLFRGASIDEVVDSYWVFLVRNKYEAHLQRFKQRLKSDLGAAQSEAVVFSLLWSSKINPDIFEDVSSGGPDFCCQPDARRRFVVEVTSLESRAVARRSKLPERIDGPGGGAFGMITTALRSAAAAKAAQLANYSCPRVLAITSSHAFATILMGRYAARNLLLSDQMISYRIGDMSDPGSEITDLRKSAFLRIDESSKVIPCRQSISAILLIAILCESGSSSRTLASRAPGRFRTLAVSSDSVPASEELAKPRRSIAN